MAAEYTFWDVGLIVGDVGDVGDGIGNVGCGGIGSGVGSGVVDVRCCRS